MARLLLFNMTKATTNGSSARLGRTSRIHCVVMAMAFLFLSSVGNAFSSPEHSHHGLSKMRLRRSETTSIVSSPHLLLSSLRGGEMNHHGTTATTTTARGTTTSLHMIPPVVFDAAPWISANVVVVAANLVGLILSLVTGSHLHLDLLGTGAFSLASLMAFKSTLLRVQVSSGAVFLWSAKLASFLFYRALQIKTDARLDDLLSTPSGTAGFWFISVVWGIVCMLPHTLGTTSSHPGNVVSLSIGSLLFGVGLIVETLADYQKWTFKQQSSGGFCNVGLWSISQHPNFCGNLLLWSGIFVMNAPALIDPSMILQQTTTTTTTTGVSSMLNEIWNTVWSYRRVGLALLSPALLWTLFHGQSTGVIGNAVELAQKKYGDDPLYQKYIETVPLLFPNPFQLLKR